MPGMSGIRDERSRLVTASGRSRPPFTMPSTEGGVAKVTCVSPETTDTTAGEPPLKGTCTIFTPVIWLKRPRRSAVPSPRRKWRS